MSFCEVFLYNIVNLFYFTPLTSDVLKSEVYQDFQHIFKYQIFKLFFQLTHDKQIFPMPQVMSKIFSSLE